MSSSSGTPTISDTIAVGISASTSRRPDIGTIEIKSFQSVRSAIQSASDVDIFELKGIGQILSLEMVVEGVDSQDGPLADPTVRILRRCGGSFYLVASNDNTLGRDPFIEVDMPATGSLSNSVEQSH